MAVLHRAHTSGFCSAAHEWLLRRTRVASAAHTSGFCGLEQLPHSVAAARADCSHMRRAAGGATGGAAAGGPVGGAVGGDAGRLPALDPDDHHDHDDHHADGDRGAKIKASDPNYFLPHACIAHALSIKGLRGMWGQCFTPSRATSVQYACMGCVYSAGSEKILPYYGGHCIGCSTERVWDLKMIGSLHLSRKWQEGPHKLGPSIATMPTDDHWQQWILSPEGLERGSLLPGFLMLKPAVTGGIFSCASLGGKATESQKAALVDKMQPGFDTSVEALKCLCASLNLTVPSFKGDNAWNTPPQSERKAWQTLNIVVRQVRRLAHAIRQGSFSHPALNVNSPLCLSAAGDDCGLVPENDLLGLRDLPPRRPHFSGGQRVPFGWPIGRLGSKLQCRADGDT